MVLLHWFTQQFDLLDLDHSENSAECARSMDRQVTWYDLGGLLEIKIRKITPHDPIWLWILHVQLNYCINPLDRTKLLNTSHVSKLFWLTEINSQYWKPWRYPGRQPRISLGVALNSHSVKWNKPWNYKFIPSSVTSLCQQPMEGIPKCRKFIQPLLLSIQQ